VLLLTPLFKNLPEAVLAALIIHAVSHLWKVSEFRRYRVGQPLEFLVGIATLVGVVTIDVLPGLVIGVVSMVLLVVYHASRPHLSVLGRVPGVRDAYGDVGRHPDYERIPDLLVLRLEAPLFYANAAPVCEDIKRLVGASERRPRAVILDAGSNSSLDITSAEKLDELVTSLKGADVDFALAEVRRPVKDAARRIGVLERIGEDHLFHTIDEAVEALSRG
jgi:MFS superfamily sulfate permease-like transporter